jgi:hypothetical protein
MAEEKKKPSPITFRDKEHEWQVPELSDLVQKYRDSYRGIQYYTANPHIVEDRAKEYYEDLVIGRVLDSDPLIFRSGIPDNLLFDDEDNLDEALVKDYNSRLGSNEKRIKTIDEISPVDRNFLLAGRFNLLKPTNYESLRDLASRSYNENAKKEYESWNYKPQFTAEGNQSFQPSRAMLLAGKAYDAQTIDPTYPIFLQVSNPYNPWGVGNPLRQQFIRENTSLPPVEFDNKLATLDYINQPQSLTGRELDKHRQFLRTLAIKDNYPEYSHTQLKPDVPASNPNPQPASQDDGSFFSKISRFFIK